VLPPEPVFFEGDPLRIEQIIVNLLYNAAKYTNNGDRIILSGYQEGEYLYIKVRDNGIGIAPEMLNEIFEPFTQAATYSKVGTGLGMGLALTKQLVLLHEGSIWATSEGHNKGSEFIVKLPVQTNNQDYLPVSIKEEPIHTVLAREKSAHEKMHILVVDDNKAAVTGITALLKHLGYTVTIAENGTEALARAKAIAPDVILLDIGLPDMSGYEVAEKFREQNISSTLIALSGYGQSEDKAKAEKAGFAYYLVKPASIVDVEALLIKIAQERNNTDTNQ
jgi:CheY-like chemotaxis protein